MAVAETGSIQAVRHMIATEVVIIVTATLERMTTVGVTRTTVKGVKSAASCGPEGVMTGIGSLLVTMSTAAATANEESLTVITNSGMAGIVEVEMSATESLEIRSTAHVKVVSVTTAAMNTKEIGITMSASLEMWTAAAVRPTVMIATTMEGDMEGETTVSESPWIAITGSADLWHA